MLSSESTAITTDRPYVYSRLPLTLKSVYDPGVAFQLEEFRRLLRKKRERLPRGERGREAFARKVGLNKSTVQDAEVGPTVPQIDSCAKMIEGAGCTLSAFFQELEETLRKDKNSDETVLHTAYKERHNPLQSHPHPAPEVVAHAPIPTPFDAELMQNVIVHGFEFIAAAIERIGDRLVASQQRSPGVDTHPPARRTAGRHSRRKTD